MTEPTKLPSLGEFLRNEREKRGLSVDQVASATKIGVKILYALEADRFDELPALPFVRGFVKNYVKFIGLNPDKILRDYDEFLHARMKARPDRSRGHSGYAFERPEGEQSRQMLWAIMGTMIVLGGLVILIFKPSLKHRHRGHVEKMQAMNPTPTPTPLLSPVASASGVPVSPAAPSPGPLVLAVASSPTPVTAPSVTASPAPSPSVATVSPPAKPVETPVAEKPAEKFVAPTTPLVLAAKPAPTAASSAVPSTVASPTVAAVVAQPSPVPSVSPSPKPDPLQTGVEYAAKEIKHKVLVKALDDVWVRYQCDDKVLMRFVLRKDRILVLRGKSIVRFQASKAESVSLAVNYQGYVSMAEMKNLRSVQGTPTAQFGSQPGETIEGFFSKEAPLPTASIAPSP